MEVLPLFAADSLWQFDIAACGSDLFDIIFDPDVDFIGTELLKPSAMSPSQNTESPNHSVTKSDPSIFSSQPFEFEFDDNPMGCDLFDDLSDSSSSSSELSPLPSAAPQASPCSSLNPKKRETQAFISPKIEPFPLPKRPRTSENMMKRSPIDFRRICEYKPDPEIVAQAKEMMYRDAVMRPVNLGPESAPEKPRRKNVKISRDPQSMAARQRRERLSERLRVLQRLVPGGSKMDTATMLAEASNYLKYLKSQLSDTERCAFRF